MNYVNVQIQSMGVIYSKCVKSLTLIVSDLSAVNMPLIFPNAIAVKQNSTRKEAVIRGPEAYSENPGGNRDGGSGFPILG